MTLPLPKPTLRVGVIGNRHIKPEHLPGLEAAVRGLLADIRTKARQFGGGGIHLTLLSSLAQGADQIVARHGIEHGYELFCPLPFHEDHFRQTITTAEGKEGFDELKRQAGPRILTLDGTFCPETERVRAYEAAARLIVRNTDLIIAIWNGKPGARGGTGETIRYAANYGPPVLCIDPNDPVGPVRWIEELHDLRWRPSAAGGGGKGPPDRLQETLLPVYLERLLGLPKHDPAPPHSILQRATRWYDTNISHRRHHAPPTPLEQHRTEAARPWRRLWQAHNILIDAAVGLPKPLPEPPGNAGWFERDHPVLVGRLRAWLTAPAPGIPVIPVDALARAWHRHHSGPDARANEFSLRYRSSYVWAFLLGALSLSAAAAALAFPYTIPVKLAASVFELVGLLLILVLVVLDDRAGWQRKSIEYRMLGELCRKQQALAPLAWAVPGASSWCTTLDPAQPAHGAHRDTPHRDTPHHDMPHRDDAGWVFWLFSAMLREMPMPTGVVDPVHVRTIRDVVKADLIENQAAYHEKTCRRYHRAAQHLKQASQVLFFFVVAFVLAKIVMLLSLDEHQLHELHGWVVTLGLAAAILPAFAAALFGVRAYAEMEMMADQSKAMMHAMQRAALRVGELDPDAPLASQELGSALAAVVTLMLEDLQGWARVFRGKVVET